MEAAPAAERGAASGLLATARITGQALSVAVAGAVFLGLAGSAGAALLAERASGGHLSGPAAEQLESTFLRAFRAALTVCCGFAVVGALAALVRGRERQPGPAGRATSKGDTLATSPGDRTDTSINKSALGLVSGPED